MSDCRKCAEFSWCLENEDCGLFKQKPQTNADRIRAMTDEELAEFIIGKSNCGACPNEEQCDDWHIGSCKDAWLNWLKQEVTE